MNQPKSLSKQVVLVAAISLRHFINEIPHRFKDVEPLTVYMNGRVKTEFVSYRYVSDENSLRGFHEIKFEVWGPHVDWVEDALPLIRMRSKNDPPTFRASIQ